MGLFNNFNNLSFRLTANRKCGHIRIGEIMRIKIKKLDPEAVIPQYATEGASGFDLVSIEYCKVAPGENKLVKTGLAFEIPIGYELQIRPRSGLSLKTPLRVANSPGTVDSDYRGEVCVIITNTASDCYDSSGNGCGCRDDHATYIKAGDRIAQGIICPVIKATFDVVDFLDETDRGAGGFGSTGK
jgi:dUTP pyrophosphatase